MAHPIGVDADNGSAVDPLTRAGYVCVLLAVPLVTFNVLRAPGNLTYGDPLLLVGGLLLGVVWLKRGHPFGVVPTALPVGAALMLVAGLLAILPADQLDAVGPTLRFIVTISLMPLILMFAASTPSRIQRLIDVWLLGSVVNALVGILDRLGVTHIGASLASADYVALQDRATGLTNHPNHLGLVIAMALPMAVSRLTAGGARGVSALLGLPILAGGVAVSGSRGALLAAVGGVLLFFMLASGSIRSRAGFMLVAALVATLALLVLAPGDSERLGFVTVERLEGARNATESDAERRTLLDEGIQDWWDRPFIGRGYSPVRPAHNIYIQFLQAGGVLALVGFLVFTTPILRRARRLSRPAANFPPWLSAIAAGSGASMCVWLLFGLVGPNAHDRYLYLPIGLVLALALIQRRMPASGRRMAPIGHERPQPTTSTSVSSKGSPLRREIPESELA